MVARSSTTFEDFILTEVVAGDLNPGVFRGSTITCFVEGKEFVKYDIISLAENNCELRMYISGSDTDLKIKCRKF